MEAEKVEETVLKLQREKFRKRTFTLLRKIRELHKLCGVHVYIFIQGDNQQLEHRTKKDLDWPRRILGLVCSPGYHSEN